MTAQFVLKPDVISMASFNIQGGSNHNIDIDLANNNYQCSRVWDSVNARFEACFIPFIAGIPAVIAALIIFGLLVQLIPIHQLLPSWLQPFVEEPEEKSGELDNRRRPHVLTRMTSCLLGVSVFGTFLQLSSIFYPHSHLHRNFHLMMIFPIISWVVACLLIIIIQPAKTPKSLLVLYISIFVSQYFVLLEKYSTLRSKDSPLVLSWAASIAAIIIILQMPMRDPSLSNDQISQVFSPPTNLLRSPEDNLTLWQFMSVSWMSPLMSMGKTKQLNEDNVWSLSYQFQHRVLHEKFRDTSGSVLKRLIDVTGIDLVILTSLGIYRSVADIAAPLLLQKILASMENPLSPKQATLTYSLIALVIRLVSAQSDVFATWYGRRSYERSRGALITMLFEKSLSRKTISISTKPREDEHVNGESNGINETNGIVSDSPTKQPLLPWWKNGFNIVARPFISCCGSRTKEVKKPAAPASMGKILNLMRGDAYEVAQRFWDFADFITQPLGLILSIIAVWKLLGWPCFIGVIAVFIGQALNVLVLKALLYYERQRRTASDTKLHKITQLVESIRHLRWYGWQDIWLARIMEARQNELWLRIITRIWGILMSFIYMFSSGMFPVVAFWAYCVWAGQPLRVDVAFPALQLFQMLQIGLQTVPDLVTTLLNARIAMGRIEDFMKEPDKPDLEANQSFENQLEMNDASFAWPGATEPVLKNMTVSFPPGLSLIYGEVASGKTALLQALLGELDHLSGQFRPVNEVVGYCAQTPWLQSMSIRDNILFSAPYQESRYKQVLDACALIPDMINFKNGDLSLIGENGIGLSGGQRARVALARAIYSNAKILFLDDPLSALDHHTAESVVKKCLTGSLAEGRIIILVTHRTELCLGMAQQIIRMTDGTAEVFDPESIPSELLQTVNSSNSTAEDPKEDKDQTAAAIPEKFMEDEHREHGGIKASVYWEYIKAGKLSYWALILMFVTAYRLIDIAETWFLKAWGEAYEGPRKPSRDPLSRLPSPETNIQPWLIGFFLLALAQSVTFVFFQASAQLMVYTAGKAIFERVMTRVVHATFRFYDVTPAGRLMNRMTSDISVIDGNLSSHFTSFAFLMIMWFTSVLLIGSLTPTFLAFAIILVITIVLIYIQFLPTSQSLRRLEMVSLTPLISNFGLLTEGLGTIRAFCAQRRFQDRVIEVTDVFQKMDHFYWSLQAWLQFRFSILSAISTFLMTAIAVYQNLSPGLTAFVLAAAARFVRSTRGLCQSYGQLQMEFVSVERVVELLHLDQEPPGSIDPPAYWPRLGSDIVFENVTIKYAPHLEPSLKNISLTIKGGSTTALIGRTGSGKSTLALSLLATTLPTTGRILIDGLDISQISTHALRTRITFLAQDPILFPGTMRMNLDPLSQHSDDECTHVLSKIASRHNWTLETTIDSAGKNLSQGQRQLVGLARALLRRSAIVVLDEATASIDGETAGRIQEVLREELRESTVLVIAHRVEAVRGVGAWVRLEGGSVGEVGEGVVGVGRGMDIDIDIDIDTGTSTSEGGEGIEILEYSSR
ncbi:putative ABC bile acid transporter [Sclerotinia borealis F-4128]|uniref:Putative ABC bile acid transporter n=1 Tax=Sclerotinia borealis (strain F-4128) TaxID=1432307 RepID=W9CIS3_SCLBF|nr:putative ABC bile acid transporter [Sclerotinia borealis F-4128]